MSDKPFVINDRRKFTAEGELRPGVELNTTPTVLENLSPDIETGRSGNQSEPETGKPQREPIAFPAATPRTSASEPGRAEDEPDVEAPRPAARTSEPIAFPSRTSETDESHEGDEALDEGEALPPLTPEQIDQAARAYAATVERLDTALRANNLGSEPMPEMNFERLVQSLYMQALIQLGGAAQPGQPPQVDIIGARQTIDMLALIDEKAKGNLSEKEDRFLQSALFEIRMGFLEITQALARQAAGRGPAGAPKGPGIVR
jgi:hypothetical protein